MHTNTLQNNLKEACLKNDTPLTETLLQGLSERRVSNTAYAAILRDVPSHTSAGIYEMLLGYTPCTTDISIEGCILDYLTVAKIGLFQGMSSESQDNKGRSALVLACASGSASVVRLLLDDGGDPNLIHPIYGTPLKASIKGCAAGRLLSLANGESLPEDVTKHAQLLVENTRANSSGYSYRNTFQGFPSYQKVRQFKSVAQMLLSRGAEADTCAGHFGAATSPAAFMGLRNLFDSLLKHSATLNASGGFIQSPLEAAILGGHSKLAKYILSLGPERIPEGLCCACKKGNLSIVKALVDSGVQSTATDADGHTALQLSLVSLASPGHRFPSRSPGASGDKKGILILLLEANITNQISDQEIVAATEIEDGALRERVLDLMIPRAVSLYFPEGGLIRLLCNDRPLDHGAIPKLLQQRKIKEIPIRVILAVKNMTSVERLVAYDPYYRMTLSALDDTTTDYGYGDSIHREKVVELLLRENDTIHVSESDILAALRLKNSYSTEEDQPDIVRMMFDRNEKLKATDEMLKAVQTPRDLEVLLAHTSPEEGLVTPAVISTVAERPVGKTSEMLDMLQVYIKNSSDDFRVVSDQIQRK